jgi:hypothetical protein
MSYDIYNVANVVRMIDTTLRTLFVATFVATKQLPTPHTGTINDSQGHTGHPDDLIEQTRKTIRVRHRITSTLRPRDQDQCTGITATDHTCAYHHKHGICTSNTPYYDARMPKINLHSNSRSMLNRFVIVLDHCFPVIAEGRHVLAA